MNLEQAICRLKKACAALKRDQGRIARRNARRRFLGVMRSVKQALNAEYPGTPKPKARTNPLVRAAKKLTWRQFELRMKHISREWDFRLACSFNEYVSAHDGHAAKPIRVDITRRNSGFCGQHTRDRIRLGPGLSDKEKWRTLFHEIAHYRVLRHSPRKFVEELARVYGLWMQFLRERRAAAKCVPASKQGTTNPARSRDDGALVEGTASL